MQLLLSKFWPHLLVGFIILAIGFYTWESGVSSGKAEVQSLWDKQKATDKLAVESLEKEYATKEATHRIKEKEITHELAEAKSQYQLSLAKQSALYAERMRQSQTRSEVYQRQAEGGESKCRDLAGYAAKLDQSLEEGRYLVRELGETIRLRDQQLIQLGQQIKADRTLFETTESDK